MILVNSSTSSGTPRVRSKICATRDSGRGLLARRSMSSVTCFRVSRLSARLVWCATAGQGVLNSGRKVRTVRMRSWSPSAINWERNSRRRGIDPVQVFHDEKERLPLRVSLQPLPQCHERFLAFADRGEPRGRIAFVRRKKEELGKERDDTVRRPARNRPGARRGGQTVLPSNPRAQSPGGCAGIRRPGRVRCFGNRVSIATPRSRGFPRRCSKARPIVRRHVF